MTQITETEMVELLKSMPAESELEGIIKDAADDGAQDHCSWTMANRAAVAVSKRLQSVERIPADYQQMLIDLVIERAEQACRYALKYQNFDSDTDPEFRSGWEVAASVCEGAIRESVMRHLKDDLARAKNTAQPSPSVAGNDGQGGAA
jgi:hypothetical protein